MVAAKTRIWGAIGPLNNFPCDVSSVHTAAGATVTYHYFSRQVLQASAVIIFVSTNFEGQSDSAQLFGNVTGNIAYDLDVDIYIAWGGISLTTLLLILHILGASYLLVDPVLLLFQTQVNTTPRFRLL